MASNITGANQLNILTITPLKAIFLKVESYLVITRIPPPPLPALFNPVLLKL
jgi:hypothetical protein